MSMNDDLADIKKKAECWFDMKNMTFEALLNINCFAEDAVERSKAADWLERRYCCEIHCAHI